MVSIPTFGIQDVAHKHRAVVDGGPMVWPLLCKHNARYSKQPKRRLNVHQMWLGCRYLNFAANAAKEGLPNKS